MSVDMKVKAIYDSEISNITRSEKNWKDVLKVAGQLYRYEFDNIVMVTAHIIMRMEVVKCVLVRECRVYLNYLESDKTIAKHLLTEMRHFLRHQ